MEESYSKIGFIFGGDAIFELRIFLNDGLIFYKQRLFQHIACNHFFALKIFEKNNSQLI